MHHVITKMIIMPIIIENKASPHGSDRKTAASATSVFAYGLRDILLIALENVFQRAAIHRSASKPEQLDRHRRKRQQEGEQD